MGIRYGERLRQQARVTGLPLVTLAIPGLEYQFVVSLELADEVRDFIIQFLAKRNDWAQSEDTREYLEQAKLRHDQIREVINGRSSTE